MSSSVFDAAMVARVARLARLGIPPSEFPALAEELSSILHWVEKLQEVDVSGVSPLTSVVEHTLPLREDRVTDGNCREAVLKNAPTHDQEFYFVPKTVTA